MATIATPTYLSSAEEHAVVFTRENGDQVNLSVIHAEPFGPIPVSVVYRSDDPAVPVEHGTEIFGLDAPLYELSLVVFAGDPDEPNKREEINLSFAETRLLRALLNKPEVQHILETN